MPFVHMLPSALVVEARLLASARVCFTKKTWQQSTVSLPRVSAEEPATKGDSTFVTDDWDVWAIHVLRPAVDLNMFITKVAAPRVRTVQRKWLVLCRGMCHFVDNPRAKYTNTDAKEERSLHEVAAVVCALSDSFATSRHRCQLPSSPPTCVLTLATLASMTSVLPMRTSGICKGSAWAQECHNSSPRS